MSQVPWLHYAVTLIFPNQMCCAHSIDCVPDQSLLWPRNVIKKKINSSIPLIEQIFWSQVQSGEIQYSWKHQRLAVTLSEIFKNTPSSTLKWSTRWLFPHSSLLDVIHVPIPNRKGSTKAEYFNNTQCLQWTILMYSLLISINLTEVHDSFVYSLPHHSYSAYLK